MLNFVVHKILIGFQKVAESVEPAYIPTYTYIFE